MTASPRLLNTHLLHEVIMCTSTHHFFFPPTQTHTSRAGLMYTEDARWVRHNGLLRFCLSLLLYLPSSLSLEELCRKALRMLQGEDPKEMMRAIFYCRTHEQMYSHFVFFLGFFFGHHAHIFETVHLSIYTHKNTLTQVSLC